MTRLRVYAPFQTNDDSVQPVTRTMYDAFQASLTLRLRLCRVAAEVLSSEPPLVGSVEDPGSAPTSVLTIRVVDTTQVVEVHVRDRWGKPKELYYMGTLYFGLDLTDHHSHQSVWSARSSFNLRTCCHTYRDDAVYENSGNDFARGIVTQLQRDGVVTSCVREAYPGCVADRLEQMNSAAQITNDYERSKVLRFLPECK